MYHPYFRGKQFELITIRESAGDLARNNFIPIIEPVKEQLTGLRKSLEAVRTAKGKAVVIVNPHHGDHHNDGVGISTLLRESFQGSTSIAAGILLKNDMSVDDVRSLCQLHIAHQPTLIHAGFTEAKALSEMLRTELSSLENVFNEGNCGKLYRKHFSGSNRILIRDGFVRRKNADYPDMEEFSDLHVTFQDEGMSGFGDYLTVGDDYSESGGPAYAVALHLTFIDPDKDDMMYIYHFVSTDRDTPTDPAGKFAQALEKLIVKLDSGKSNLTETSAIREFRELHTKGHFPGLGYVKKLSMKHHIETLGSFLNNHA